MINLYCDKCKKPIGDTCYCKAVKTVIEKIKKELPTEWQLTSIDLEDKWDMTGKEMPEWKKDFKMGFDNCLGQVKDILNKYE